MRPKDRLETGAQLMGAAHANPSCVMRAHDKICGFTLVELLVSMLVGLLILYFVYNAFTIHNQQFNAQELGVEKLQSARVGLDFVMRELRLAGYNPTGNLTACKGTNTATNTPCAGIVAIANNSISFTADLNGNGNLTPDGANPDENITYDVFTSGNETYLGRTSNGVRQPLAMNITALSLNYYDGSNQITTNLSLIRKIRVSVTARAATSGVNKAYQTLTLSSDIVPRSLAY
jgi:type IV pilus assembly protein PilW